MHFSLFLSLFIYYFPADGVLTYLEGKISGGKAFLLMSFEETKVEKAELSDEKKKMPFLNSGYWFVWDPCGIICAVMTYILILYGELVVLTVLAPPFPSIGTAVSVVIFTTFATLAVVSHVKAMVTDPVS